MVPSAPTPGPLTDRPPGPNLPTERLVLGIGSAVATVAYLVWTADTGGWSAEAAVRAGGVLAGVLVLALVLRVVRRVHSPPREPPGPE